MSRYYPVIIGLWLATSILFTGSWAFADELLCTLSGDFYSKAWVSETSSEEPVGEHTPGDASAEISESSDPYWEICEVSTKNTLLPHGIFSDFTFYLTRVFPDDNGNTGGGGCDVLFIGTFETPAIGAPGGDDILLTVAGHLFGQGMGWSLINSMHNDFFITATPDSPIPPLDNADVPFPLWSIYPPFPPYPTEPPVVLLEMNWDLEDPDNYEKESSLLLEDGQTYFLHYHCHGDFFGENAVDAYTKVWNGISFTATPVPEPGTVALILLGGIGVLLRGRHQR
ncbi:MAG: PEP-CTERM sorting domain-containing protein [Planctomycetes bacterium]|nr:PEP-CTERM sorting domain-containing protein [Planctomycetota bacterium]